MINFTCVKDHYAYIYLLLDFIIITILSITFQEGFSTYMTCALTSSFLFLVLKEKPYGGTYFTLENSIALYLQFMLLFSEILLCIIKTTDSQ